ncbi:hypothetical protein [Halorubrum sp. BV1]|uniref:hypothetical protein n=1 Tax=Halorubrum sp. BV1 TaxID=1498500 RepID=UPI000679C3C8|nr:hypothetical protein [Halorubrum sp. BV1]
MTRHDTTIGGSDAEALATELSHIPETCTYVPNPLSTTASVERPDGQTILEFNTVDDAEMDTDTNIAYPVSTPDGTIVHRIEKDGLLGGNYTLYDAGTDQPIALYEYSSFSISNQSWQIKDPETEEVTHEFDVNSRVRSYLNQRLTRFRLSQTNAITTADGEEVGTVDTPFYFNFLVFFALGSDRISVEFTDDAPARDVFLTLLYLMRVKK